MVAACWESVKGDHSSVECVWISGKDTVPPPLPDTCFDGITDCSKSRPSSTDTDDLSGSLDLAESAAIITPALADLRVLDRWPPAATDEDHCSLTAPQVSTPTNRTLPVCFCGKNHSLILVFHYHSRSQRFTIIFGPSYSPTRSISTSNFSQLKKNRN